MGNESLIHSDIKNYSNSDEDKKKLHNIFMRYINARQPYLTSFSFQQIFQLYDKDIFEIIYKIFSRKESKNRFIIGEEQLNEINYCFTSKDIRAKTALISYLIYQNKDKLVINDLISTLQKIFQDSEIFVQVNEYFKSLNINQTETVPKIEKVKKKDSIITRKNFKTGLERSQFFRTFKFIQKKWIGSSEIVKENKQNDNINDNNNNKNKEYICDCDKKKYDEAKADEESLIKYAFESKTRNKVLLLGDLYESLLKLNIHEKLIDLIIEYLRKLTQKDFCCFKDINLIFEKLCRGGDEKDKIKFLIEMVMTVFGEKEGVYPCQIDEYLDLNSPIKKKKPKKFNMGQKSNKKNNDKKETSKKDNTDKSNKIANDKSINSLEVISNSSQEINSNSTEDNTKLEEINTNSNEINTNLSGLNKNITEEEVPKEEKYTDIENLVNKIRPNLAFGLKYFDLLPYLILKAKTNKNEIKKKLVKYYLEINGNITHEKYLEKYFDSNNEFYIISKESWDSLINDENEAPNYINNSKIAIEDDRLRHEAKFNIEYNKMMNEEKEKKNKNTNVKKKEEEKKKTTKIKEEQKENKKKKEDKNGKKDEKGKENKEGSNEPDKMNERVRRDTIKDIRVDDKSLPVTKIGRLKPNLKYNQDFIILCGELYSILKNYFPIDFEVKLSKIIQYYLINKKSDQKEKNKDNDKEGQKEKKDESGEGKKNEKKEEKDTKIEEEEPEDQEENLKKENYAIEHVDKFIVDEEKGQISKIIKDNKGNYYRIMIDCYQVEVIHITLAELVRLIEKSKVLYDDIAEREVILKMTDPKQREKRENNYQKAKNKIKEKKIEFQRKEYNLKIDLHQREITREMFDVKMEQLRRKYQVYLDKPIKNANVYETDLSLTEFMKYLSQYKNTLREEKVNEIYTCPKDKTFKELKKELFMHDHSLKKSKPNFYFSAFEKDKLQEIKEEDLLGKSEECFIAIIIDIPNDKNITFYKLLKNNDKGEAKVNGKGEKKDEKTTKKKEQSITKEEKQKLEKDEKERDRILKEKEKKLREEQKILEQKEKEKKQKLKEEEKRRERELQRQLEKEQYRIPPYGINNYGNTCYFNSVNQIFFNLPILQQIFVDPRIDFFINKENTFGHQGKFFELYKALYWIKYSKVGETVKKLKKMVGKLKADFDNNDQQDANEYLNFVIEHLHEELNLHSFKVYIEEKDDLFNHNSDEIQGNISWSNNLKRNTSFIDSIFMFQLKSNLACKRCNTKKINFETNYIFNLPLSLCKIVTVEINLYKLPFIFRFYYNKINPKFDKFTKKEGQKGVHIIDNLWNYYKDHLTMDQKSNQCVKLHFSFDLEREKKMLDITKMLRGIKPLELEPEDLSEVYNDDKFIGYQINHYTDLITYSEEKNKLIYPDEIIDKYVNMSDKIVLNVYEVLNSNGMNKLYSKIKDFKLYSYKFKKNIQKGLDEIKTNIKKQIKFQTNKNENKCSISLREKLIYFPNDEINNLTLNKRKLITEFEIPIYHYYVSGSESNYLFREYIHSKIRVFPLQYVVLSNSYNIQGKDLYEYIWQLNTLYMNHPNIDVKNCWWKNKEIKKCYPFILRYTKIPKEIDGYNIKLIHCPKCPWYSFCPGCIIDPEKNLEELKSNYGIVVDWCAKFIDEEFCDSSFREIKEIDNQVISENLPINEKDENYQSIRDCFNLFFAEENLDDPLYCHHCKGPENFSKKYLINRLPYVLILSLKRFKFNQNFNFKLRQMITYPLYNFELEGKKYDLYGVINHYGGISSGHYTCIVKNKKKWMMCDDSHVYEIEENKVMHANAYILFYISQESPSKFEYFSQMRSLMNHVIIKDKEMSYKKDINYFKGELVHTQYGDGYVIEDNIVDFKYDDKYNIYDDLVKKDKIRVKEIIQKQEEEDKKMEEEKNKNKKGNKKDEKKEEKKDGKKEEKKDEKKEVKKDGKNDGKNDDKKGEKKEEKKGEKKGEKKEEKKDDIDNKIDEKKVEEKKSDDKKIDEKIVEKNVEQNKKEEKKMEEPENQKKEELKIEEQKKEEEINEEQKIEEKQNEEKKNEKEKKEEISENIEANQKIEEKKKEEIQENNKKIEEDKKENNIEIKEENKKIDDKKEDDNKEELKNEIKDENKEENKGEQNIENKEEIKEEHKEETKVDNKEENKEEKKDENKIENKEENKNEIKDEIKEDIKDENKEESKETQKAEDKKLEEAEEKKEEKHENEEEKKNDNEKEEEKPENKEGKKTDNDNEKKEEVIENKEKEGDNSEDNKISDEKKEQKEEENKKEIQEEQKKEEDREGKIEEKNVNNIKIEVDNKTEEAKKEKTEEDKKEKIEEKTELKEEENKDEKKEQKLEEENKIIENTKDEKGEKEENQKEENKIIEENIENKNIQKEKTEEKKEEIEVVKNDNKDNKIEESQQNKEKEIANKINEDNKNEVNKKEDEKIKKEDEIKQDKKEVKNEEIKKEENKIIEPNQNNELKNEIIEPEPINLINENKEKKLVQNAYSKLFVRVKFEFGEGYINRANLTKYNDFEYIKKIEEEHYKKLKEKEKEKKKKK